MMLPLGPKSDVDVSFDITRHPATPRSDHESVDVIVHVTGGTPSDVHAGRFDAPTCEAVSPVEPPAIAKVVCWWAGSGDVIEVTRESAEKVAVKTYVVDSELPPEQHVRERVVGTVAVATKARP